MEFTYSDASIWPNPFYFQGDISLLLDPCVGIIGSRDCSSDASKIVDNIVQYFKKYFGEVVIASGLAKGVDYLAHNSAIRCELKTIGVIGTRLDETYPPENKLARNGFLQEEIAKNHLLISPFSKRDLQGKADFPLRNKLLASLCDYLFLVEAAQYSGTVHAIRHAILERKIPVFAHEKLKNLSWLQPFVQQVKFFADADYDFCPEFLYSKGRKIPSQWRKEGTAINTLDSQGVNH